MISFKKWWSGVPLGTRVLSILSVFVLITMGGGSATMIYSYRMNNHFSQLLHQNISSLDSADKLETALINQKGFLTYYYMDGDEKWLDELAKYRKQFDDQLIKAKSAAQNENDGKLLDKINVQYRSYIESKDRVIELYKLGDKESGSILHKSIRTQYFSLLAACEEYKEIHRKRIDDLERTIKLESYRIATLAAVGMTLVLLMAALMALILVKQILIPIQKLSAEADRLGTIRLGGNEMSVLTDRVHFLLDDVDQTRSELERSRERLILSEKMAVVGKLAAEVAHSIRNPMTSITMRLFSLEKSLDMNRAEKEDFEVVREEMRRLDNIVRNFLEFSRPPKLKKQMLLISDVVTDTLQLLQYRIEKHNVSLSRRRGEMMPLIEGDRELLKEVLVNLIVNACEAMTEGGKLSVGEEDAVAEHIGRAVSVIISDTGPGVPDDIKYKIMEPFFSTKEYGTGLGLSIASRIIREHGGFLTVWSPPGQGATFIITLPVKEDD